MMRRTILPDGRFLLEAGAVDSTQEEARALVRMGETRVAGIRADHQRSGRGRLGRVWHDEPGASLLVTYLEPAPEGVGPELGLAAGAAVAQAIEDATNARAALKWPNDVLMGERKAAGILTEIASAPAGNRVALFGIGINLNQAEFPPELRDRATSLFLESGCRIPAEDMELLVRKRLYSTLEALRRGGLAEVLPAWRERDCSAGRCYVAELEGMLAVGTALGIAPNGLLRLQLQDGRCLEAVSAVGLEMSGPHPEACSHGLPIGRLSGSPGDSQRSV